MSEPTATASIASASPFHAEAEEQLCKAKGSSSHGFFPSTLIQQHPELDNLVSFTPTNPFYRVEVLSSLQHWNSQPITPSPHAYSTTDSKVRSSSSSTDNHYDFCPEEKRIGYDGTNQTPSVQLLKPTASSLGHQVPRASFMMFQPTKQSSPSRRKVDNNIPYRVDSSFIGSQRVDCACDVVSDPIHDEGTEHLANEMTYTESYTTPMNPFGKLGRNPTPGSGSVMSEEEEGVGVMTKQISPIISSSDAFTKEGMKNHFGGNNNDVSRPGLHRRASWSQGSKDQRKRGFSGSNRRENASTCPERLRSLIIDPVASQLLRECDDIDSVPLLSFSTISRADLSHGGEEANPSCHSSLQTNKGCFLRYSSMPDLLRSNPSANRYGTEVVLPPTKEASSSACNYPLSPKPLFRILSDRLLDVKTEDDIKSLVRPVPRKLSVSTHSQVVPLRPGDSTL